MAGDGWTRDCARIGILIGKTKTRPNRPIPPPHIRNNALEVGSHFVVRNQEKRFPREHFALLISKSDLLMSISLLLVSKSDFLVSNSLLLVSKSDVLMSISLLLVSKSDFLVSNSLLLVSKSDFLVSNSLLLVSKSDFLVSISLFLVSKSDFLVADELASFSEDLSPSGGPQPGQARRSAGHLTPTMNATSILLASGPTRSSQHALKFPTRFPYSPRWRLNRYGRIARSASNQLRDVQLPITYIKLTA